MSLNNLLITENYFFKYLFPQRNCYFLLIILISLGFSPLFLLSCLLENCIQHSSWVHHSSLEKYAEVSHFDVYFSLNNFYFQMMLSTGLTFHWNLHKDHYPLTWGHPYILFVGGSLVWIRKGYGMSSLSHIDRISLFYLSANYQEN